MSNKINNFKHIYRLPPCPAYDIEGTECWLENMADSGYFLSKDGFFAGFAIFEKKSAKSVRYRLEAASKSTSMWSDEGGAPDDEAIAMSMVYGWEYIANRGSFHIFVSENATDRELNTDPKVQALALDTVRKREQSNLTIIVLWMFLYLIFFNRNVLMSAIGIGTWLYLWGTLLVLWALCGLFAKVLYLRKLKKRLSDGNVCNHKKNWNKNAKYHKISGVLFILLTFLWIGFFLNSWKNDVAKENKMPLNTYTDELPFATIESLIPHGDFTYDDFRFSNTIEIKSDWIAPDVISLFQTGSVNFENGCVLQGGLDIDYYETTSPWIANELAHEYQLYDRRNNKKHYQVLEIPELDVDYASAYMALFPTVILVDGNKMIRISFYQTSDNYTMPIEEWVQIFAENFTK